MLFDTLLPQQAPAHLSWSVVLALSSSLIGAATNCRSSEVKPYTQSHSTHTCLYHGLSKLCNVKMIYACMYRDVVMVHIFSSSSACGVQSPCWCLRDGCSMKLWSRFKSTPPSISQSVCSTRDQSNCSSNSSSETAVVACWMCNQCV